MNSTKPTDTTQSIQRRFFGALQAIQDNGGIVGLQTFCSRYGLNRTKYSRVRTALTNDTTGMYHNIDIDALSYVVRDYGINAEWLLTGNGEMFTPCTSNTN